MSTLLLNPIMRQKLTSLSTQPPHAILLVGPSGSGKGTIAQLLISELLGVHELNLKNYPYFMHVTPNDRQTISIDAIRDVIRFTTLKTVASNEISRVVLIEDSQRMSLGAQNALLKTLEEPPEGTTIVLTAPSQRLLLPTILSRLQIISLLQPESDAIKLYFEELGFKTPDIDRALLMSGGLLGLMNALLEHNEAHPLVAATKIARAILEKTPFERLVMIDELSNDKKLCFDTLFILEQMASLSLRQSSKTNLSLKRWQRVLAASHTANQQLLTNAQTKLVLLNFMLAT
jgi:energy-coupling factor transporter ATP-binding protein EcfA2